MWARLDGCILDKIPRASVSRASWAWRGGQSCSIQLRILDITVLVARVLETREAKVCEEWGSQKNESVKKIESWREKEKVGESKWKADRWENWWLKVEWSWGHFECVSSSVRVEDKEKCVRMGRKRKRERWKLLWRASNGVVEQKLTTVGKLLYIKLKIRDGKELNLCLLCTYHYSIIFPYLSIKCWHAQQEHILVQLLFFFLKIMCA